MFNELKTHNTSSISMNNTANDFGTVNVTSGNAISVVDANAMTLGPVSATTLTGRTLTGDLTLGGNLTVSGGGDSLVLAAGDNFVNSGAFTLNSGAGRWLIYSSSPLLDTRGGLTLGFKHYNQTYGAPYGGPGTANGFLYSVAPTITPSLIGTTSKIYDATTTSSLVGGNYSSSGAIDGDTVTLNNPAAGTYTNKNAAAGKSVSTTVSIASASNGAVTVYGYTLATSTASGNIGTITQLDTTVSGTRVYDASTVVNGTDLTTVGSLIGGDGVSVTGAGSVVTKNVGVAKAVTNGTLSLTGADAGNYNLLASGNTLTVTQAPLTITADDKAKMYGGTDPVLTASAGAGQLMSGDTLAGEVTGLVLSTQLGALATAGTHAITAAGGTAANYSITHANGTLTVAKAAALSVTADDKAKTYGAADPSLTYTVGGTLHYTDTASVVSGVLLSTNTGATATAGTHTITATGGTASNYNVAAPVAGTLTVAKAAALTVTADDKAKTYGAADPSLTYTVGGTLYYTDTAAVVSGVSLVTNTGAAATAGTHTITATGGTASNYNVAAPVAGTLTVDKAMLSVVADDKVRDVGAANPVFTAGISGYKLGENDAVLGGTLQFTTAATPNSLSGIYAIQPYGLSAANYTFYYGAGNLFVGSTAGAPTTGVANQMTVPVASLTTVLQGDLSAFGTSSIIVTLPGGFSFLNALPATGAGVAGSNGTGGAAGSGASTDESTFTDNLSSNNSVSPTGQRLMRANCFGQPLQRLKCSAL